MKQLTLVLLFLYSQCSFAEKGMNVLTGTNLSGTMKGEANSDVKAVQYSFDAYYSPQKVIKKTGVIFGSHLQFSEVEYELSDIKKQGLHTLWGIYAGVSVPLYKKFKGIANYTLYPYSTLVVAHQSRSKLNDETVNHSSLSSFSGDIGQAFRFF